MNKSWNLSQNYALWLLFWLCRSQSAIFWHKKRKSALKSVQNRFFCKQKAGTFLSSRSVSRQVFSARLSLTTVFGMGTGGTWALSALANLFSSGRLALFNWRLAPSKLNKERIFSMIYKILPHRPITRGIVSRIIQNSNSYMLEPLVKPSTY